MNKRIKWILFTILVILCAWYGPALIRPEFWFETVAGSDPLSKELPEKRLKEARDNLEKHVKELAFKIGQRSYLAPKKLEEAASYIKLELDKLKGKNSVRSLPYRLGDLPKKHRYRCTKPRCMFEAKDYDEVSRTIGSIEFKNIEFEIRGCKQPDEVIVIGAHYDSDACESSGCNLGADDNATGVAALIELAGMLTRDKRPAKTLRFVAFVNEEEPFFQTETMGSYVYARETRRSNERVKAMLSLETMGYFSDKPGSQTPKWLMQLLGLPTTGNFITFVGNWASEDLTRKSVKAFRGVPAEGLITYPRIPGVSWSDHWSYWQHDVQAVMVTDTALARNFCYHQDCDIRQRLDYDKLTRVVMGLAQVIKTLDQQL